MDTRASWEALKELLRIVLIAAFPIIAEALLSGTFEWGATALAVLTASGKAVDKYFHEDPRIEANGLVPF